MISKLPFGPIYKDAPQVASPPAVPALAETPPRPAPAAGGWAVDPKRSLCRGRESLLYFTHATRPVATMAERFPELAEAAAALEQSPELATLRTIRTRLAAADARCVDLQAQVEKQQAEVGEAATGSDEDHLHDAIARLNGLRFDLADAQQHHQTLREAETAQRAVVLALAERMEAEMRSQSSLRRGREIAAIQAEIGAAISQLLDRWAAVQDRFDRERSGLSIPGKMKIIDGAPALPVVLPAATDLP